MNLLTKVLVVDSGRRSGDDALSSELAELGLSSVTTSVEAADDVLDVIDTPSAIFLNMPHLRHGAAHQQFLDLAARLRAAARTSAVPIILWEPSAPSRGAGISALLRSEVGPQVLCGREP